MQKFYKESDYLPKGKKVYQNDERLHYMDQALDLSQPDYKRFRLGKYAHNVMSKANKRNNSIDSVPKGTFVPLKHPYEWDAAEKKPVPYSFIKNPVAPSQKVTTNVFSQSVYNDGAKNNNPVAKGMEIATRLNYMERDELNKSAFMNTKYLKNYSTLGSDPRDGFSKSKNTVLYDPKSVSGMYLK